MKPSSPGATVWRALLPYRNWLYLPSLILAFFLYTANLRTNPPGFFVDESSIALNAYTIAQSGADEHGNKWPLYFRAFGEYKNPTYIYLLAGVFKVAGPGILAARLLSATLGFAAALVLGALAFKISQSVFTGTIVGVTALLTPWLFEISRLVFEVALYPLVLATFLWVLYRTYSKDNWSLLDSLLLATGLTLLTYSYSTGRVLAPLLALGLVSFAGVKGWRGIATTWLAYAITLLPLLYFNHQHPGALTERFYTVSYIGHDSNLPQIAAQFIWEYIKNLNLWGLLVVGDWNSRHHVMGMAVGFILLPTGLLALWGLIIACRQRHDPWWRFILYGLAVSIIPGALTNDDLHGLRIATVPVFFLLLLVPALQWSQSEITIHPSRRRLLTGFIALTLVQAALFQWSFHQRGPARTHDFETHFPHLLDFALSNPARPIYLVDGCYAHAYWYGILKGVNPSTFKRAQHPPSGALVICYEATWNTERFKPAGRLLRREAPLVVYIAPGK